jgi:hypothetical protein
MFFPFHDQHGMFEGCETAVRDQLVGSCGGDWACMAILLDHKGPADYVPTYLGLTGEQIPLDWHDWFRYGAHHFNDDDRINLNVYKMGIRSPENHGRTSPRPRGPGLPRPVNVRG